jgi:uncharacterized protein (DUF1330 family)
MTAYLVGAIDIHEPGGYELYRDGARAALKAVEGVELLSTDDHPVMLEGAQPAGHLLFIRFRSLDALQSFYNSEAYQQIIGHRHGSSTTRFLMAMRGRDEQQSPAHG